MYNRFDKFFLKGADSKKFETNLHAFFKFLLASDKFNLKPKIFQKMQFFFLCFEMYCKCVAGADLEGRHDEIEEKRRRTDR